MSMSLVGRATEVFRLQQVVNDAQKRASLVLIRGAAGIGKSALLTNTVARCAEAGFQVCRVFLAVERESSPLSPLLRALDFNHSVMAAEPAPAALPVFGFGVDSKWKTIDSLCDEVSLRALNAPLCLAVDDLHWADETLLIALRSLRRRLHDLPILIVGTMRPLVTDELLAACSALESESDDLLEIGPLTSESALLLARNRLGFSVPEDRLGFIRNAAGNPLLIHEFSNDVVRRKLLSSGSPLLATYMPDNEVRTQIEAVDRLLALRLASLPVTAKETAKAAAVFGFEFLYNDLAAALLPYTRTEVERGLAYLSDVGILSHTGETVQFAHDLLRDGIQRLCTSDELSVLHANAARVLASRGAPASSIAWHIEQRPRSDDGTSADLFSRVDSRRWLVHAAQEAAIQSPALGAHLLAEALRDASTSDVDVRPLFVLRIEYLASSGQVHAAERVARHVLEADLSPTDELTVRWWLTNILFTSCRLSEGLEVANGGLQKATSDLSTARLLALIAMIKTVQLDPNMNEVIETAEAAAERAKDPPSLAITWSLRSRLSASRLEIAMSKAAAQEAVAIADRDNSGLAHRFQPLFFECLTGLDEPNNPAIQNLISHGRKICQQNGTNWAESLFLVLSAVVAFRSGRFDDCIADALASKAISEETEVNIGLVMGLAQIASVNVFRGEFAKANEVIRSCDAGLGKDPLQLGVDSLAVAKALRSILLSAVDEGITISLVAAEFLLTIGQKHMVMEAIQPALYFVSFASDRRPYVERLSDLLSKCSDRPVELLASGQAIVRAYRGDSLAGWQEAIATTDRQGWQLRMALVRMSAALAANRVGERQQCAEWTAESTAFLRGAGASQVVSRFHEILGVRKDVSVSETLLSKTEQRVAALLAEGMSNRQIADRTGQSIRTVEAHVASVLRKLDVRSRAKAAALLRSNDL